MHKLHSICKCKVAAAVNHRMIQCLIRHFYQRKKSETFPEMPMVSHFANRKWSCYLENWDSSVVNYHLVHFFYKLQLVCLTTARRPHGCCVSLYCTLNKTMVTIHQNLNIFKYPANIHNVSTFVFITCTYFIYGVFISQSVR